MNILWHMELGRYDPALVAFALYPFAEMAAHVIPPFQNLDARGGPLVVKLD
jgi:hypothetical protein